MQTIYYRGFIKSCNYRCSYCAFAKRSGSLSELQRETDGLRRFYEKICRQKEPVQIFFLPYGEGLIHSVYQEAIADLSALPQVQAVGIQTNLSLEPESFLQILRQRGNAAKVRLWATYHAEMTTRAGFVAKVKRLAAEVAIAAGMVATPEKEEEIRALRAELPPQIYLWLNAMDRRKAAFSQPVIERLREVDPMFGYEFAPYRDRAAGGKGFSRCLAANQQYLDKGILRASCFFQKGEKSQNPACHNHRRCDCYLGYSNFIGNPSASFFGENRVFRIPQKRKWQAIFLDFDGVLTENGGLRKGLPKLLEMLAAGCRLYLATARSFSSVRRALGQSYAFFSGGVFFDGAYILDRQSELTVCQPILPPEKEEMERQLAGRRRTEQYFQGELLRIGLPTSLARQIEPHSLRQREYGARTYFQAAQGSKASGIERIMTEQGWAKEEVLVMTDNPQDSELLHRFPYTAVPLHQPELAEQAYYTLNAEHLPLITELTSAEKALPT